YKNSHNLRVDVRRASLRVQGKGFEQSAMVRPPDRATQVRDAEDYPSKEDDSRRKGQAKRRALRYRAKRIEQRHRYGHAYRRRRNLRPTRSFYVCRAT